MSPRTLPALVAAALLAALAGCGGTSGPSAGSTPSASPAEPSPARQQAAAEASADPARATDVRSAGLAAALRAADLPAGWSVQANPVPDTADLGTAPSLAGICGGSFPSEAHRTVKYPVVGLDPQRTPLVESEAIGYDGAASATAAVQELRAAFAHCTTEDRTILAPPRVEGLAADAVVVEYQLTGGTTQEVLAQRRGAVVSVLLAEDEDAAAAAARRIAGRLAALPATAAGG